MNIPGTRFRAKLLLGMMLVVLSLTALGLFLAQRKIFADAERESQQNFLYELAVVHGRQEIRHAALTERCRALVERPRIHAALEDNALDLLYPSAKDELRDVMASYTSEEGEMPAGPLTARFYRFLDGKGVVISPAEAADVGKLSPEEEAQLNLPSMPSSLQIGYIVRNAGAPGETIDEVIALPINSSENGDGIGVLVLGFPPSGVLGDSHPAQLRSGLSTRGHLDLVEQSAAVRSAVAAALPSPLALSQANEASLTLAIRGMPHLLFYKQLNPGSLYPPGYEVAVYPLAGALARQQRSRVQILGAGAVLLLGGLLASHFLAGRLAAPVEKLAVDSEENRRQRAHAEAVLQLRDRELARAARFSADASHQLKTPVTVLRAGLDEILAEESLPPEKREEIASLIHQTYRLTSIIEDLLLLSRMDAGRLQIDFRPVNLTRIIEGLMDDLSALPDALDLQVEADCRSLTVLGEERYVSLIMQNVLENARKYNREGGRIRIVCREEGDTAVVAVGNTGRSIPPASQEHIFERFHRGRSGENIPGHGLGLNLAQELTRLHGGALRLLGSEGDWTEFELRFRLAPAECHTGSLPVRI